MENVVNNSKIYKCTHYKTYKCKSFIILNDKNKYHNNHNHLEEDYNATIDETSLVKTQMMRTINKQYPFNVKTFNEIPDESKFFKIEDIFVDCKSN
ncbi:hypothetical protein PIROE2DRAFT_17505 [Piromyces sp. E2]|nr:hypothetical protein PIROE2DRAFT_17505 [Piromyces sp. E2]|eukprot:OUM57497.1 hypothetical protein PIROE2DRAFT_17505 [Piromyces sp. E2]